MRKLARLRFLLVAGVLAALLVSVGPAQAITGGQPDGNRHPYTGLLLAPGITRRLVEEPTAFGALTHLTPVAQLTATPARWATPVVPLGTHPPAWAG